MKDVLKIVCDIERIEKLTPPQELAIKEGLLDKGNLVVSSPTASGKTLIGLLACVNWILNFKKKALYVVPLKAIANEKYEEFSKKYNKLFKVGISTGDYDSPGEELKKYDLIILTIEKLDSLIRHNCSWIKEVGCIVFDEIHLLNDPSRGPTLEILITKVKKIINPQIIALSATISNADEIAKWLEAKLIVSNYRPVELKKGVYYNKEIKFDDKSIKKIISDYKDDIAALIDFIVNKEKKQIIIFVKSRKSAESLAKKLQNITNKCIREADRMILRKISKDLLSVLEIPTKLDENLSELVKKGIAFHHAGLLGKTRKIIEDSFRKGYIKVICATPTLAMGVNMPSTYVLIRDLKRYDPWLGSVFIPVMEVHQCLGRAGRPKYDKIGYGLLYARHEKEVEDLFEKYIFSPPEKIESKLVNEVALRMHVLALIVERFIRNDDDIEDFFSQTFFGFKRDSFEIYPLVKKVIDDMIKWKLVKFDGLNYYPTVVGKRVAELYIDPLSAHYLIEGISNMEKIGVNEINILDLIIRTTEIPPLNVKYSEYEDIERFINSVEDSLLLKVPERWTFDFEYYVAKFKVLLVLLDWINEKTEREICDKYNITPGELFAYITNAEWIAYSLRELYKILGKNRDHFNFITKFIYRIRKGVKEELLELVSIPNIGRVRARKLYNHGIKNISDIKKIPLYKLQKILGEITGKKVKEFVENL